VLVESPPDSLDDRMALSAVGQRLSQLITPGLLTFDDACRPVPDLAESFVWLDPRTVEFRLRPDLRFHDGSALTSADVVATYESVRDPALGSPRRRSFDRIARVQAVDERTVRFHLDRPFRPVLAEMSLGIIPAARASPQALDAQGAQPIGAGPFRVASSLAHPGEPILLLPNAAYPNQMLPKAERLSVQVVRDETTRVLSLLNGDADVVIGAVSPAILPALRQSPRLSIVTVRGTGFAYLVPNVRGGPAALLPVRRAICHAIDRESIVRFKLEGLGAPAAGMLPVAHWAHAPVAGCAFDPALAERLLDEAGFPRGPDGVRLTLSLKTSTDRIRRSTALVLREQLRRVGIQLEVRPLEFGVFFGDVRRGSFELGLLKWASVIEPDLMRGAYSASQVPDPSNGYTGFNRGGFADPVLDELLERAAVVEPADRAALYARAQARAAERLPVIPLWHEDVVTVLSSRVRGYRPSAHGFFRPLEAVTLDEAGGGSQAVAEDTP
jgi:peptide/nickel transport system substrate-binding protein